MNLTEDLRRVVYSSIGIGGFRLACRRERELRFPLLLGLVHSPPTICDFDDRFTAPALQYVIAVYEPEPSGSS